MENAVNIMAMVQKSGVVKQKFDVPSKPLGTGIASFRNELSHARKEINKDDGLDRKAAGEVNQNKTEKKIEKLARVMSSNNSKAEIKTSSNTEQSEEPSVDALGHTDATEMKPNSEATNSLQTEQPEEKQEIDEPVQAVLDALQQLIQMMQGQKMESGLDGQDAEITSKLETVIQKLEQLMEGPVASQGVELSKLLSSLNNDLNELVSQLESVSGNENDSMQVDQLIQQLMEKLDKTQKLQNQILQQTEKPHIDSMASKQPLTPTSKVQNEEVKADSTVMASNLKVEEQQITETDNDKSSDKRNNDEGGTSYKANENNALKQAAAEETQTQPNMNEVIAPQVDKENFQLNIKQANVNLQKESLIKFSSSDIMNQVIKKADILVQGGHQEMVMKLEPESLGKLNLKIVVENGIVTAKFIAESQQVKEVIESSFNQLKDALQEKGVSVQGLSVSIGQQGAEFSSGKGFDQWKQTIKLSNKTSGQYLGLDEENSMAINPYGYHEGKVDYRA